MSNIFIQQVEAFKEFISKTTLDPEVKIKFIELFAEKGYLSEEENHDLISLLHAENAAIDSFIATNLS